MSYTIETRDCKGDGATYKAATYKKAIETVTRLLLHGTKYIGDRIDRITIARDKSRHGIAEVMAYVEGGNTQGARADSKLVAFSVCDQDNIEAGDEDRNDEYEALPHGIY